MTACDEEVVGATPKSPSRPANPERRYPRFVDHPTRERGRECPGQNAQDYSSGGPEAPPQ